MQGNFTWSCVNSHRTVYSLSRLYYIQGNIQNVCQNICFKNLTLSVHLRWLFQNSCLIFSTMSLFLSLLETFRMAFSVNISNISCFSIWTYLNESKLFSFNFVFGDKRKYSNLCLICKVEVFGLKNIYVHQKVLCDEYSGHMHYCDEKENILLY